MNPCSFRSGATINVDCVINEDTLFKNVLVCGKEAVSPVDGGKLVEPNESEQLTGSDGFPPSEVQMAKIWWDVVWGKACRIGVFWKVCCSDSAGHIFHSLFHSVINPLAAWSTSSATRRIFSPQLQWRKKTPLISKGEKKNAIQWFWFIYGVCWMLIVFHGSTCLTQRPMKLRERSFQMAIVYFEVECLLWNLSSTQLWGENQAHASSQDP